MRFAGLAKCAKLIDTRWRKPLQDVLSDDEPVPLVGEKRGCDDDDDPILATGTQTGSGHENQNENENKGGTRTEPEEEEEESGPASPVFNQAWRSR